MLSLPRTAYNRILEGALSAGERPVYGLLLQQPSEQFLTILLQNGSLEDVKTDVDTMAQHLLHAQEQLPPEQNAVALFCSDSLHSAIEQVSQQQRQFSTLPILRIQQDTKGRLVIVGESLHNGQADPLELGLDS